MDDCVFCKIIEGSIPCDKVFENDRVLAFRDIHPQAPVHILIVPKPHVANLMEGVAHGSGLLTNMMEAAARIAAQEGLDQAGFRLLTNCGESAGQSVLHLHFHLLGGRALSTRMA